MTVGPENGPGLSKITGPGEPSSKAGTSRSTMMKCGDITIGVSDPKLLETIRPLPGQPNFPYSTHDSDESVDELQ